MRVIGGELQAKSADSNKPERSAAKYERNVLRIIVTIDFQYYAAGSLSLNASEIKSVLNRLV